MSNLHADGSSPEFATNTGDGQRVADAINALLKDRREEWANRPDVAIATAYFNPGGFNLLADELEQVGQVRLLLGADPAETSGHPRVRRLSESSGRRRRSASPDVVRALEGHARAMNADRDFLGFTREADVQARRLVAWLRDSDTVHVRRYTRGFLHGKAFIVERNSVGKGVLAGSSNFTYAGLARNNELNLGQYQPTPVSQVVGWFNDQWDTSVPFDLAALYEARWQPHQPWDVFLRMLWEMYGADLDEDTKFSSHLGLTQFQADGVWRAKRILERRNGVLVADEVGLGKTFLAGEMIYEAVHERRQKVLVIAPATLRDSTWDPFLQEKNLRADVRSFEQLVAGVEDAGTRNSLLQTLDEYALVIVDEAHALRSGRTRRAEALRQVLAGPVPKDLVLMTATPVNNSLEDLYNLISYFAPNDAAFADVGITSLRTYFNAAIATNPDDLSPEQLFDVLDEIAVRRTRKFVKSHYAGDRVTVNGQEQTISFPTPRVRRVDYDLAPVLPGLFTDLATALGGGIDEETTADGIATGVITSDPGEVLTMARYVPSRFLLTGATEQYEAQNAGLIRSMLLKRFESSAYAFEKTLDKMITSHNRFLSALARGLVLTGDALREWAAADSDDVEDFFEDFDDNEHITAAAAYDVTALTEAVTCDRDLLESFRDRVSKIQADTDPKVDALIEQLATIAKEATDEGIGDDDTRNRRKTLVFTYYADTAAYLDDALATAISSDPRLADFRGRTALVAGPDRRGRSEIIVGFAPLTAGTGSEQDRFDLLIATDVLAEGVNLQQAKHIINYDLPWNPMRLVQRHGRIDRIGSPHREVFLRCFFPDSDLDAILDLETRLQRKLKQAAASIGAPHVLPGVDPVERNLSETRDQIERLRSEQAALFDEGGGAALSGEEYRRRLASALDHSEARDRVLGLPWGSGTGFIRGGDSPGYVFCARIGDHPKPWFRYVAMNPDLTVQISDEGVPYIIADTLACLDQADPGEPATRQALSNDVYHAAFDAWQHAQDDIYNQWMLQTDPANLQPSVPRTMRDAAAFVTEHGGFLAEQQERLASRLNAPYAPRVQKELRRVLMADVDPRQTVEQIRVLADELGLQPPPPPVVMPMITREDIHLVCWTAICPET